MSIFEFASYGGFHYLAVKLQRLCILSHGFWFDVTYKYTQLSEEESSRSHRPQTATFNWRYNDVKYRRHTDPKGGYYPILFKMI